MSRLERAPSAPRQTIGYGQEQGCGCSRNRVLPHSTPLNRGSLRIPGGGPFSATGLTLKGSAPMPMMADR